MFLVSSSFGDVERLLGHLKMGDLGFPGWPAITNLINNVFRVFCNRLCFSCIIMTGEGGGDGRRDKEVLPASCADGFRYVSIMAQFIWMIVAREIPNQALQIGGL